MMDVLLPYVKAFLVGGLLCVIGQVLIDRTRLTPARILTSYVVAGVVLGALGLYQPLVDFAGAGADPKIVRKSMIIDIMKSVLFGIVEGITEWLPVSSTGHMILLNEFVTMNVKKEFWDMFLVVIQLGAILAVVLLYWHDIWPLHRGRGGKHDAKQGPMWILDRKVLRLWAKTIVACVPAAVVGLALDDWIDAHFYNWICT